LKEKDVVIWMPVPAIGDSIAWFSYVERFQKKHSCNITCVMNSQMIDIFSSQYPEIKFTTPEKVGPDDAPYATYYLGLFLQDDDFNFCPEDYRHAGLMKIAAAILCVDTEEIPPRVDLSAPPVIHEPYVCISVMASSQPKFWNNPFGWNTVVKFLIEKGYRVICIDKLPVTGDGLIWNHIPREAEEFTGELPLQQRIDLINHADFFIGHSSGLSWLAWCCRKDIVLISGFTHPCNEFQTPFRIINKHVCNSCWNDMRIEFDMADNLCCPRRKGTPEHFECTRQISPEKVIEAIKAIPIFRQRNIAD
jgi:autotransporter strand-loop-strand O-heptosyltransferase